ncbi:hypothetical protein BQ8794_200219 [Mesorhizobium prunaredense]|uniref:Uncharacterized protein n=1 Tax=Mesorhizobium prunaredense TaxID=1631249 RepID=A0A1R3VA50_9HYPH|nr:hypothetical protein BQ8794_200219 [Mesorhizobium prunaredense]
MAAMRPVQRCRPDSSPHPCMRATYLLTTQTACGLETTAAIVYIRLKFLVGMAKSGSTRSRSFLLPSGRR